MRKRTLDSLDFALQLYRQVTPAMSFKAANRASAMRWQKVLRRRLTKVLGGFPKRCPLRAEVTEVFETEQYRRETVLFQSRAELTVFGYFFVPKRTALPGSRPCVICVPGHGRGVDSICGVDEKGQLRPWGQWGEYQADFALQAIAHGYTVFAIEQLGFGRRRDAAAVKAGADQSSCQPASGAAFLLGETMTAWRVWDVIRAVDYLQTRREVDAERLGVMGISGGGLTSFFSAALDERISAAVVSGYFNTFKACIFSLSHCIDNYFPGMLQLVEMPDIAGLIAPRPVFFESGTKDNIFPIEATRQAYRQAQRIYRVFGAPKNTQLEIFEGEHQFWGRGAFEFLAKQL
jgi:dienelactone hydrolase